MASIPLHITRGTRTAPVTGDSIAGSNSTKLRSSDLWKELQNIAPNGPSPNDAANEGGREYYAYFCAAGERFFTLEAYDGRIRLATYADKAYATCVDHQDITSAHQLGRLRGRYGAAMLEGIMCLLETARISRAIPNDRYSVHDKPLGDLTVANRLWPELERISNASSESYGYFKGPNGRVHVVEAYDGIVQIATYADEGFTICMRREAIDSAESLQRLGQRYRQPMWAAIEKMV